MTTDRKILGGVVGGLGFTVISIGVGIVQLRLLLHFLSAAQAGTWLLFLTFGNYIALFDLGVGPTLGREISFASGAKSVSESARLERIGTLIRTCTSAAVAVAAVTFLICITGGWAYLKTVIPADILHSSHTAWLIFIVGASINLVGQGWFAGIFGLGEVVREKTVRCIGQLLGISLLFLALHLHLGLSGLAVAFLVQAAITIALARRSLRLGSADPAAYGRFDIAVLRRIAAPSVKYAATMLGGILILQTDNLVIASRLGTRLIPDYQAASRLVLTMMALSTMLAVNAAPFQSRAHAQEDVVEIKRLLQRSLKFSLSIMAICGCVMACFADSILALWLGPGHFVGFNVVWVLLGVMFLEAHHAGMASATMATGRIVFTVPALLAGVLNIAFSVYLAGRLGLFGVALGTMCAQIITNNWYVPFYTMRQFHISFISHLRSVLIPILSLIVLLLGVGYGCRILLANMGVLMHVLVGCVSIGLVGVCAAMRFVLSSSERNFVWMKMTALSGGAR